METVEQLRREVAQLESQVDYMQTEYTRLHELLVAFGFDDGIYTLSESLEEAVEVEKILRRGKS